MLRRTRGNIAGHVDFTLTGGGPGGEGAGNDGESPLISFAFSGSVSDQHTHGHHCGARKHHHLGADSGLLEGCARKEGVLVTADPLGASAVGFEKGCTLPGTGRCHMCAHGTDVFSSL